MIKELELVALTVDLPDHGLRAGDIGTVVDVHGGGKGYQVEFMTVLGETVAVAAVLPDQIRRVGRNEIPSARLLESGPTHTEHNPEQVAYWYFRLNGCLTIINLVIHPDLTFPDELRSQRTDVDILAARFPYRRELITSQMPMIDDAIFEKGNVNSHIDVIVAEVKRGECNLNGPWMKPDRQNMQRLLYWIGILPQEEVDTAAHSLYSSHSYQDKHYRIRLIAIGGRHNNRLDRTVTQLTWSKHILPFIYDRLKEYQRHKSQHEQWDRTGKWLYDTVQEADNKEDFIKTVQAHWK